MNDFSTRAAIVRGLALCGVLDVEHTAEEAHRALRAVRHELETLRGLHCPTRGAAEPSEPSTSAVRGLATRPGSLRHQILEALHCMPLADFQLHEMLMDTLSDGPPLEQVRRRRHELWAAGWVRWSTNAGRRTARNEATGQDCVVHELTDAGAQALRRLNSGQAALFTIEQVTT